MRFQNNGSYKKGTKMIVTLSGITGIGKSFFKNTIVKELGFTNLVIVTTRKRRNGEINGIDKEFVSDEEFEQLRKDKKIVVDFEFLGAKYAYRKKDIESDSLSEKLNNVTGWMDDSDLEAFIPEDIIIRRRG